MRATIRDTHHSEQSLVVCVSWSLGLASSALRDEELRRRGRFGPLFAGRPKTIVITIEKIGARRRGCVELWGNSRCHCRVRKPEFEFILPAFVPAKLPSFALRAGLGRSGGIFEVFLSLRLVESDLAGLAGLAGHGEGQAQAQSCDGYRKGNHR
jgi:hypothetical protein